ncbi:galactose-3-O-sulfotransferase 1 [Mactra antiquata]
MPNDTVFIASVRSPWEHFKSTYNYFAIGEIGEVPNEDIRTYLNNISFYNDIYMSSEKNARRWCIPDGFSITKNLQAHCLGLPVGFPNKDMDISNDTGAIEKHIADIAEDFGMVIVVDYFAESLVLLKRTMCWSFKDIIYHHSNAGNYKSGSMKHLKPEGPLFEVYRKWSNADFILFEHFNNTLWKKIRAEGPDIYDEIEQFRLIQMLTERFCFVENMWQQRESFLTIPRSKFDASFNITGEDCALMNTYMLPMLWAKFYEQEGIEPEDLGDVQQRPRPQKGCSI